MLIPIIILSIFPNLNLVNYLIIVVNSHSKSKHLWFYFIILIFLFLINLFNSANYQSRFKIFLQFLITKFILIILFSIVHQQNLNFILRLEVFLVIGWRFKALHPVFKELGMGYFQLVFQWVFKLPFILKFKIFLIRFHWIIKLLMILNTIY